MTTELFPTNDVAGAIQRLEHHILSHCGEDAFEETLKLLLAKLHDEDQGTRRFAAGVTREISGARFDKLFRDATDAYPGLYPPNETTRLPASVLHEAAQDLAEIQLRAHLYRSWTPPWSIY